MYCCTDQASAVQQVRPFGSKVDYCQNVAWGFLDQQFWEKKKHKKGKIIVSDWDQF
jgi:hypothetical protein